MLEASKTFLPYLERTEGEVTVLDMGWVGSRNTGYQKGVIVSEPEISTDSGLQTDLIPGDNRVEIYTGDFKQNKSFWYLVRSDYEPGERIELGTWRGSDMTVFDIPETERQSFRDTYNQEEGFYSPEEDWLRYFQSLF